MKERLQSGGGIEYRSNQSERQIDEILVDPTSELLLAPLASGDMDQTDPRTLSIADHTHIRIAGELVELSPTLIAFFNTLSCAEGEYLSTIDLTQIHNFGPTHVNTKMPDLCEILGDTIEIVGQKGNKPTLYRIRPDVSLIDERHSWTKREFFTRRHIIYENDEPVVENDRLKFKSKVDKVSVGSAMLRDFKNHPAVDMAVTRLMSEQASRPLRKEFDLDEERLLFDAIEQAMIVYVREGTALLDDEMTTVVAGVEAAYGLYFSHSHLIERAIGGMPINYLMWTLDDLRQEASIALMEAVLRGIPETRGDLPFAAVVPTAIRNCVATRSMETEWSNGQRRGARLYRDFNEVRKAQRRLQAIQDHTVTHKEIAKEVGMSEARVKELIHYGTQKHAYLDSPADPTRTYGDVAEEAMFRESLDFDIERFAMQDDVDALFASDTLSDNEKAVMSLYHGIFSRRLCGAELLSGRRDRGARIVFTYPYDEEAFLDAARQAETLQSLDKFLGLAGFSAKHYRAGLQKAVSFIEQHGKSVSF